jgi:tripeptidyl-peptidase I
VPISYQKRQCNEYLKLGLQGVSFLFASGDAGVGNYPVAEGGFDGPQGCLGPNDNIFNPTWPNTCPYITNVVSNDLIYGALRCILKLIPSCLGCYQSKYQCFNNFHDAIADLCPSSSQVYPGHTVFEPESAVFDPAGYPYSVNFSSGGGFSNVYPVPDYQKNAVSTFFAEHKPTYPSYSALATDEPSNPYLLPNVTLLSGSTGGIYNRMGRGVPDVAANGDNIATYTGGEYGLSGGTSASTPIFASIINRINEERLSRGKGPVGPSREVVPLNKADKPCRLDS